MEYLRERDDSRMRFLENAKVETTVLEYLRERGGRRMRTKENAEVMSVGILEGGRWQKNDS